MSFKLLAFEDIISQWISIYAYQQPQDDLRMLMLAILGKPRLPQLILAVRFKIYGSNIIKNYADSPSQYPQGMFIANPLNFLLLRLIQLVQITVNHMDIYIYKLVFGKVIGRSQFTGRKTKPCYY